MSVAQMSNSVVSIGPPVTRATILAFQDALLDLNTGYDGDANTTHHFAPGLYARQFDMKAGDVIVGKIHRHAHLIMLVFGDATIADEFDTVRMTGPQTWVSTPGVKRAIYAHEDTRMISFHPTDETDLEKIESDVIAKSYEALDTFLLNKGG